MACYFTKTSPSDIHFGKLSTAPQVSAGCLRHPWRTRHLRIRARRPGAYAIHGAPGTCASVRVGQVLTPSMAHPALAHPCASARCLRHPWRTRHLRIRARRPGAYAIHGAPGTCASVRVGH